MKEEPDELGIRVENTYIICNKPDLVISFWYITSGDCQKCVVEKIGWCSSEPRRYQCYHYFAIVPSGHTVHFYVMQPYM